MNKLLKNTLLIYVLFCLINLNGKAQDLTTGLISVWELDETGGTVVNDALNSHNGTNVGSAEVNITGKLNKCYDFDGINDIVDFNTKLISGFPFSLSIWF
jgi:hypothetical protein